MGRMAKIRRCAPLHALNSLYQLTIKRLSVIRRERDQLRADLTDMTERAERAERENRVLARMVEMSTGLIPLAPKIDFISRLRRDAEAELGKETK